VLEYVLPSDKEEAVALCGRLLRDVYEMRADDELIVRLATK
jgi:hypothetical protein